MYLDDDKALPTLCGTGTEDYIGSAWALGQFSGAYQGCLVADKTNFRFSFYRLHVPDPVYFRTKIRVTIQQIGFLMDTDLPSFKSGMEPLEKAGGKGELMIPPLKEPFQYIERSDDWASCAYFSLDAPESNLPGLIPAAERMSGL